MNTAPKKELIFSLTEKDFEFIYTKGSGKGGQKKNKTSSAVYCKHRDSNSHGYSEDTRSQHQNKIIAFRRCVDTPKFKAWHKIETARRTGALEKAKEEAERQMKFIKVEVKQDGKWVDEKKVKDPCPDCGSELLDGPGGGVKCSSCKYWFCY